MMSWITFALVLALAVFGLQDAAVIDDLDTSQLEDLLTELEDREVRNIGDDILKKGCKGKPADIAFIIDSSRSIYYLDYNKQIDFLRDFVKIFKISPTNVRIAAVSFGQVVIKDTAFGFSKYSTEKDVLAGIKNIRFRPELGGETRTELAIAYARNYIFNEARPGVSKIAIVLTDGKSRRTSKTISEAAASKKAGIEMIAIGVGRQVSKEELKGIASRRDLVFEVNSYAALKKIRVELGIKTCAAPTTVAPPTTTTVAPTTTTPMPKEEPCDGNVDINFVFDSAMMGNRGTDAVIHFIKKSISEDDLNKSSIRVGAVTGPCKKTYGFHLNTYKTRVEISKHFDHFHKTELAPLISEMHSESFRRVNGGRRDSRKVAVIFLKGKLNNPAKTVLEAKIAREKGIEVFTVNLGSLNSEALVESLVSHPADLHILRASDENELKSLTRDFADRLCKENPKKKPDC